MDLSLYALSLYAQRLLARGLEGLGLTLSQAAALKKTDARKQALAWLVKSRTVVGDEWIVARLAMGHRSNGSRAVSAFRQPPAAERQKLLRILHTCTDGPLLFVQMAGQKIGLSLCTIT